MFSSRCLLCLHLQRISIVPGLVLLPSFVSPGEQRDLVRWSLRDQARYPNDTNLDIHYHLPKDGLWNAYLHAQKHETIETLVLPRFASQDQPIPAEVSGPRKLIDNIPVAPDNFLSLSAYPKGPAIPSPTAQASPPSALVPKLRWANIGWSYHWGSKQYDFSKGRGVVEPRVRELCKRAVATVPWERVFGEPEDASAWGDGGPDWMTWDDTYGDYPIAEGLQWNVYDDLNRTGCRNCQFLSNEGE
jgi:alkylated DNA repair protein alkB homolog 1